MGDVIADFIGLLLSGGFFCFFGFIIFISVKKINKTNKDIMEFKSFMNSRLGHIAGLPIARGVYIDIFCSKDKITFKKDNIVISLKCDKIKSVDIYNGSEVRQQAISGAAFGKILFGGTGGAVVGSLASITLYLAITYKDDSDETKFIIFDASSQGIFARKFVKTFNSNYLTERENIEL